MIILFYDCYRILSKVYKDGAYLKQAINDVEIEELNRAKTTKICYGVLDKDITLNYYISKLSPKSPKSSIKILLKIAIYNIKYLSKKPYAVIDSTVELSKKLGKGANAGYINAVLRKFISAEISLPEEKLDNLSIKFSYPKFAVEKIVKYYPDCYENILSYDKENTFVRFKGDFDGEKYLTDNKYTYYKTPFQNLFLVDNMKMNEDFYKGVYTFQSIGSVAICNAVDKVDNVLDACAAPGGKSVYLAEKCKNVTSCEFHPHRLELIKSYVKRMGLSNVTPILADSSKFNGNFLEKFDGVLCDVPCSGYGTLKTNPDIKLKTIDFKSLNQVQLEILNNCFKYLKVGGSLYYSTCTIFKEENDDIIGKFLALNSNAQVKDFTSDLEHKKTKYGLQFLPHISFGAGFYISKITKV